jgi:membrane protease YdiL (CAAX protease family)
VGVLGLAAPDDQPVDPLAQAISARTLLIVFAMGGALSALPVLVVTARHAELAVAISAIFDDVWLFGATAYIIRSSGQSIKELVGPPPPFRIVLRLVALAVVCMSLMYASAYLVWRPLNYWFPGLHPRPPVGTPEVWQRPSVWFATVMIVTIVIAGPFAEEWFFRGLLLRRFTHKWNARAGTIVSSAIFALLHPNNPLGSLVFAVLLSQIYATYRSLWAPVIVHGTSNALAIAAANASRSILPSGEVHWTWAESTAVVVLIVSALALRKSWLPMNQWDFSRPPSWSKQPAIC